MSPNEHRVPYLDITVSLPDMLVVQSLVSCQLVFSFLDSRLAELCGTRQQLMPELILTCRRFRLEGGLSGPYIWTQVPGRRQLYRRIPRCRVNR
jgi:hypothetical protein